MGKSDDLNLPPLGIGAFSSSDNVAQMLLVVGVMALVILEGLSWFLAALVIMLLYCSKAWNRVKQSIVEAGMGALVMHAEDEVRVVATSTPDHEAVGWMNEIIEQIFQRCLRLHVSPEMLNNQLEKMQKSFSGDDPVMAELVPKLKVLKLTLGNSPLVISRMEANEYGNGVLELSIGLAYRGDSELVLQLD